MSVPGPSERSTFEGDKTAGAGESPGNEVDYNKDNDDLRAALPEARQAADLSLPNNPMRELAAISTMLLIFGWIYVGPLLALARVWYLAVYGGKLGLAAVLVMHTALLHSDYPEASRSMLSPTLEMLRMTPENFTELKHVILEVLNKASGGTMPEGIAGIFPGASRSKLSMIDEQLLPKLAAHNQCYRAEERGYLSKRKGFVKVAMQAGADIVPSYILGQSQEINESAGIMQESFYGRWYLPIPNKIPLTVLVGKPISVAKGQNPDTRQIDKLHAEVMKQVKDLYLSHRHLHGWKE